MSGPKYLVTGAGGFVGNRLALALLAADTSCTVVMTDVIDPPVPAQYRDRATSIRGDILKSAESLVVSQGLDAIFCLHGIMSGQSEADWELGMVVNFDATRALLNAAKKESLSRSEGPLKFIFTSSLAVYGGDVPTPIDEYTAALPQSSYGTEKAMCEYLVNDYSRRGFIDGRTARLPTVCIRPGKPSSAASSYVSGIVREPLHGVPHECPVPADTEAWVTSPRTLVSNLIHVLNIPAEKFGCTRTLNLPGFIVTVNEQIEALRKVKPEAANLISMKPDAAVLHIVNGWLTKFNPQRALSLGCKQDHDFSQLIEEFIEDSQLA